MKVAVLAYDGVAAFELGCAIEIFLLPRPEFKYWYEGEVVTLSKATKLNSTGGLSLEVKRISTLEGYNTLVVPSWPIDQCPDDRVVKAVQAFARCGRVISFCSGAFLLGYLGLLDGRSATTHWRYAERFQQLFPNMQYCDNVLYLYQDRIGCSAGSAAALDLGIAVIREDFGQAVANAVARRLVLAPHREGGQAQFVEHLPRARPSALNEVANWALDNLEQPLRVEDLAARCHMSRRSFDRHFRASYGQSPLRWLTTQRLARARSLLESEALPLTKIAELSGFGSELNLHKHFGRCLGTTPARYRRQFRRAEVLL